MLLRETIRKTKFFFNKTLQNLKSFFFGGYQKLPKSLSFRPLSRRSGTYAKEQFYYEFYDQWQADLKRLNMIDDDNNKNIKPEEKLENVAKRTRFPPGEICGGSNVRSLTPVSREAVKEKNKKGFLRSESEEKGIHVLAKKMKQMEMMMMDSGGDVENLLDIEEALHYYSRLTSPVYLDIVDKFFMDMHYSEFSLPSSLLAAASNTV